MINLRGFVLCLLLGAFVYVLFGFTFCGKVVCNG